MSRFFTYLFIGFTFFWGLLCFGDDQARIIIIKSKPITPYNLTVSSFKKSFSKKYNSLKIEEILCSKSVQSTQKKLQEINSKFHTDFIFCVGTPAIKVSEIINDSIPRLAALIFSPEKKNYNFPCISINPSAKQKLAKLLQLFPKKRNIGFIYSDNSSADMTNFLTACEQYNLNPVFEKVSNPKTFSEKFEKIIGRCDCYIMFPDSRIYFPKTVEFLLRTALDKQKCTVGLSSVYTRAGTLLSFECDFEDIGKQSADLAFNMLENNFSSGKKTISPRKLTYSLNLIVADRIGVSFSKKIIKNAKYVVEK